MNETVQLIFQIKSDNQAVLSALKAAVSGVNEEVKKGSISGAELAKAFKLMASASKEAASADGEAASRKRELNAVTVESIVKGTLYSSILQKVISATREATLESAQYASRTQQLNVVMDQLARTNNLSVPAVRAQADAVKALGITTQESRSTINNMIFAQLDLAKATDLARLAQNAAKIAGVSSSEALNGIIAGIVEQRIQMLRTYGIQVSFEQAFIRGAAAMGKSKEALTDYERANLALNEVLAKGPRILGVYEISLTTAAGQMQSMKRYIDEARNALGDGFIPILQKAVSLLTDTSKSVNENADAYQALARHITAAGVALAAAKLSPGGPVVKGAVGVAAGVGAELLSQVDAVEQGVAFAKEALAKVEKERREATKRFNESKEKDAEAYLREDKRLADLQLQIQHNLTESLAQEFKKRRDAAGKGSLELQLAPEDSILPFRITRGNALRPFLGNDPATRLRSDVDLGGGRKLTNADIDAAIKELGKEIKPDLEGLRIKPDISSQVDALLGKFTERVKEASKTAQSNLDRAKESLLSGEARIEQARRDALAKVAEEFQSFNRTFADTLAKTGTIKDSRERSEVENTIRKAQAQYGSVVGRINQQFNLELEKERRSVRIDELKSGAKVADALDDARLSSSREASARARALERARLSDTPGTAGDEKLINNLYRDRVRLAEEEASLARSRSQRDLEAAREVFKLNGDGKALRAAKGEKAIADIKVEAALTKEKSQAELDKQIQILELRRKQRQEAAASLENAFREAEAIRTTIFDRRIDQRGRATRLREAQALPGNEALSIRLNFQDRLLNAQDQFEFAKKEIEERRKAAYERYQITKDSAELEKTSVDLRLREIRNAYTLEKEIADARVQREVEIAAIRRQQSEELRRQLGSLYDALVQKGKTGLQDFFRGYFEQIKKQIFVNLGEELFRGTAQKLGSVIPGQEKVDPVTGRGTGELTLLGRILRGTPLGVDPAKLAVDRQINAQDRNTKALEQLTIILGGGSPALGGSGGIEGLGNLGGILIKNLTGKADSGQSGGLGGLFSRFLGGDKGSSAEAAKFGAKEGLAAGLSALPGILGGIRQGGVGGTLSAIGSGLGAASSIPGPQQPFLQAGSILLSLFGGLFGGNKVKEKEQLLEARLSQKFVMPEPINLTTDLAGNAIDYDFRGRMRTYGGGSSNTNITVNVQTMDAKSFMDNGPMIAEATRAQWQLGHPLQATLRESLGVA